MDDYAQSVMVAYTQLDITLKNGSLVPARKLDISELRDYCQIPTVNDLAGVLLHFAHSGNYLAGDGSAVSPEPPSISRLIFTAIFVVVGVIGFIGNLLTVVVIRRTPSLRTQTNYFLASLAVSDLLLILVGVPFDLFYLWRKHKVPAFSGYCELTSTSISWFTFTSILTIVALTAERLVAICYPFSLRALFDHRTVVQSIVGLWIFSFFPSLYIGLQFKPVVKDFCGNNRQLESGIGSCDFVGWSSVRFDYTFEVMLLLTFVLPIAFILYCYAKILATLNEMSLGENSAPAHVLLTQRHSSDTSDLMKNGHLSAHSRASGSILKSQKAHRTVLKMLLTVTVVFFLCYLPYHIERLIVQYTRSECSKSTTCVLLYPITGLLQYVSATLNPIIYNLMSPRFRTAFRSILRQLAEEKTLSRDRFTAMPMSIKA